MVHNGRDEVMSHRNSHPRGETGNIMHDVLEYNIRSCALSSAVADLHHAAYDYERPQQKPV